MIMIMSDSAFDRIPINTIYQEHKQQCDHDTCCRTNSRSGGSPFCHTSICTIGKIFNEHPGCDQTDCRIKNLFQYLRDRSWHHITVCLKISSVYTQDSGKENRW